MSDPISKSLEKLVGYFDSNSIPYVIVGGVAVIVTGRTRMTTDVDIILDHEKIQREDFVDYLVKEGFDANLRDFDGFDEKGHCSIFFKEGMFRIDIKGIYSDLDKESIKMSIDETFNNIPVKINHPINTILFKLKFGSEQDYESMILREKELRMIRKNVNKNVREKLKHFHFLQWSGIVEITGKQVFSYADAISEVLSNYVDKKTNKRETKWYKL